MSAAIGGRHIQSMVIPSAALNAFALEDFKGMAVIGVTEGLLSRLNRYHIESVVAHEAGHIISGDCLSTTITSSLAAIYEETLERIKFGLKHVRGSAILIMLAIYAIIGLTSLLNSLLNCFVSRQRECRADAIAVRLTRDPLSLAEALRLISKNWRGSGAQGDKLESIFIVSPSHNKLDEQEGLTSDLFSTHPPILSRINSLLDMAHTNLFVLDDRLKDFRRVSPVAESELKVNHPDKKYFVFLNQNWLGPFSFDGLKNLDGFRPDQWVRCGDSGKIQLASDDIELLNLFHNKDLKFCKNKCPYCKTGLSEIIYEGVTVLRCGYCEGVFVQKDRINRILVRDDKKFSEETVKSAKTILEAKEYMLLRPKDSRSVWKVKCPDCNAVMGRQFFQYSYPVEIDRCVSCGGIWFDKNELEILQYFFENNLLGM